MRTGAVSRKTRAMVHLCHSASEAPEPAVKALSKLGSGPPPKGPADQIRLFGPGQPDRQRQNVSGERMTFHRLTCAALLCGSVALLGGCGGGGGNGLAGIFGPGTPEGRQAADEQRAALAAAYDPNAEFLDRQEGQSTFWDLFENNADPNTTVEVNKYLWYASLDILNFLPIESVDPFTGVIVTGYGAPPGGGRAYRATVYVQDPALDARSLRVALQSRGGGAVPVETQRAVEDAILTRARQLRIRDGDL